MAADEPVIPAPIGVIACGGPMPGEVIDAITRRGLPVHIIAIAEETNETFGGLPLARLSWAKYGAAIASLKAAGVGDVIMVGRMTRPRLRDARPDFGFIKGLTSALRVLRAGGDDALLRAVVQLFEPHGFRVVGVKDVAPELLIGDGLLAGPPPDNSSLDDVALGMALIDAIGAFDIGQAAVVSDGRVIAIEGAEGTDKTIARVVAQRSASHRGGSAVSGGVLVKRPKPGQDLRVDLPTIGPDTVAGAQAAGLSGIAVEAGWVIAAQRRDLIARANEAGVFVLGTTVAPSSPRTSVDAAMIATEINQQLRAAPESWRNDAELGCKVASALQGFAINPTLVVRRNRVITIGVDEPLLDVVARTYASRSGLLRRRSGVMIVSDDEGCDEVLFHAVAALGLAALIVVGTARRPQAIDRGVFAAASRAGISLMPIALSREQRRP